MDETIVQMAEVDTGLTTAPEQYKFSESTPFQFHGTVAGPSGTQPYMNPGRAATIQSPSVSSLRDTASKYSRHARLRGAAARNGAAGDGDGGAAGGAAGGSDGGAVGDNGNRAAGGGVLPPPPDAPPSEHGWAGGRRISRRQQQIKELEIANLLQSKNP